MLIRPGSNIYFDENSGCVDVHSGTIYDLDEVGFTIINEVFKRPHGVTLEELISNLVQQYDGDVIEMESDVRTFIEVSTELGILLLQ